MARPPPEDPPPLPQHASNGTHSYATRPISHTNSSLNSTTHTGLVGVRIRLNEPLFAETARLFRGFFGLDLLGGLNSVDFKEDLVIKALKFMAFKESSG